MRTEVAHSQIMPHGHETADTLSIECSPTIFAIAAVAREYFGFPTSFGVQRSRAPPRLCFIEKTAFEVLHDAVGKSPNITAGNYELLKNDAKNKNKFSDLYQNNLNYDLEMIQEFMEFKLFKKIMYKNKNLIN